MKLLREPLAVEPGDEVAHPIALEPQREIQLLGRHHFVIGGAIAARRRIARRSRSPQNLVMRLPRKVFGILEQVLEEMRTAAGARRLVRRTDAIHDVDRR